VDVGELRARVITLKGTAYTDANADNLPDDIKSIADAQDDNDRAMVKDLKGETRYGRIRGFTPSWSIDHPKGRTWTCAIVVDE
jgi:hypothetical protein